MLRDMSGFQLFTVCVEQLLFTVACCGGEGDPEDARQDGSPTGCSVDCPCEEDNVQTSGIQW